MSKYISYGRNFYDWLGDFLKNHPLGFVYAIAVITLLFLIPLFFMQPTETASDDPTGNNTVIWYDEVQENFPSEAYSMVFIAENEEGNMLTQKSLYALYLIEEDLRNSDLQPFLYESINNTTGIATIGIYSLADAVNTALIDGSYGTVDLSNATDLQVQQAIFSIFSNPATEGFSQSLSIQAGYEETAEGIKLWHSPALTLVVYAIEDSVINDYPAFTGGNYSGDIALEHFGRDILELFRSQQDVFQIWGVNIDRQLEINDEGSINAPLLVAAIIIILAIVAIIFRSFIITFICGSGLIMVLIWLNGFSNLVGIKNSTIVDLIVPIVVLVLGIDYAIHAISRYREERRKGYYPEQALGNSTRRVGNALTMAMLTTVIAFIANSVSNIESIVQFAVASSFAIFATYIILGLFAPTLVMLYNLRKEEKNHIFFLKSSSAKHSLFLGKIVAFSINKRFIIIPLVLIITIVSLFGWGNLQTELKAEDALDPASDFVIGLDKVREHIGDQEGETAIFYIKGDFTQYEAIEAMYNLIDELEDDKYVARLSNDNSLNASTPLLDYLAAVVNSDYTRKQIELTSGIVVTDNDNDLIPDTSEQLLATYEFIIENGISLNENIVQYTPQQIKEDFIYNESTSEFATLISIGIPGTAEQSIVKESSEELNTDLDNAMSGVSAISFYGLTGDAYLRDAQFSAIADSMTNSFLIAIGACFILLLIIFRSVRFSIITLIPVVIVVCWLYGLMYIFGYDINLMTATIASISIGIGIDYCIHFTERFRQEFIRTPDKKKALLNTAGSTGIALLGSGVSTASGFAVITFAPMPMFSTFGVLTAVMVALSFMVAVIVLPGLLYLFTPSKSK